MFAKTSTMGEAENIINNLINQKNTSVMIVDATGNCFIPEGEISLYAPTTVVTSNLGNIEPTKGNIL